MRILLGAMMAAAAWAQQPNLTKDNKLIKPADYREWIFLSSGLAMKGQLLTASAKLCLEGPRGFKGSGVFSVLSSRAG